MYSPFKLFLKYISYYIRSSNGRGHGVHSPFVYEFIRNVLLDKKEYPREKQIEERRRALLNDHNTIDVIDFGAGSGVIKTNKRMISKIAASSLKPKKYSGLLGRIANYYRSKSIVEIGTSFGITTSYLAASGAKVITLEGDPTISEIASETFIKTGSENIEIVTGNFSDTLSDVLNNSEFDLVYVDGNHRYQPTIDYFEKIKSHIHEYSFVIFDDIHWSEEMEAAWEHIKKDGAVRLSIDLFFIGIVLFRKEFKAVQHFSIRF